MKGNEDRNAAKRNIVRKKKGKRSITEHNKMHRNALHAGAGLLLTLTAVLFLAVILILKTGSVANAAEGTDDIEYKYYTTITVEKGETLWDLALENYSEKYYDSIDSYVEEVKTINGLKSDTIHEGAKLVIVYFSSEYK